MTNKCKLKLKISLHLNLHKLYWKKEIGMEEEQ